MKKRQLDLIMKIDETYPKSIQHSHIFPEKSNEQTTFNVLLISVGQNRLKVLKILRSLLHNMYPAHVKELLELAPVKIADNLSKDEAIKMKSELEDVGAVVKILPL